MAYARRREHWIFIDSRGAGLYEKIKKEKKNEFIGVWKQSGTTFGELVELAANHLENFPFDVVYIAGGVNNVTTKNKSTGKITFNWNPPEMLISHLVNELRRADYQMTKNFPASKVGFCTLVGSDLSQVVNAHTTTLLQQESVDAAIFAFNDEILKKNKGQKTFSPSLHRTIHRSKNGKQKNFYDHLEDGIHLQDYIQDNWAIEFSKAASAN